MYEAMTTVIGTVVTHPLTREVGTGEQVLTFRVASTARRFDPAAGHWVDSGTLYLTVSCWNRLVAGVAAAIRRGDPVIVHGRLRTHEYRTAEGVERRDLEMRADGVGPDLARCRVTIARPAPGRPEDGDGGNTSGGPDAVPVPDRRTDLGGEAGPAAAISSAAPDGAGRAVAVSRERGRVAGVPVETITPR